MRGRKPTGKPDEIYEGNFIVYRGSNPIREEEQFMAHGLTFHKGVVYEVSDKVYEYLKGQKYFIFLKGVCKKLVDFR